MNIIPFFINSFQQLSEVSWKKRSYTKFWKFHRKTPVLESLYNKVAGL